MAQDLGPRSNYILGRIKTLERKADSTRGNISELEGIASEIRNLGRSNGIDTRASEEKVRGKAIPYLDFAELQEWEKDLATKLRHTSSSEGNGSIMTDDYYQALYHNYGLVKDTIRLKKPSAAEQ